MQSGKGPTQKPMAGSVIREPDTVHVVGLNALAAHDHLTFT